MFGSEVTMMTEEYRKSFLSDDGIFQAALRLELRPVSSRLVSLSFPRPATSNLLLTDTFLVEQAYYITTLAPRTSDGAISHRTDDVQLWADFMYMASFLLLSNLWYLAESFLSAATNSSFSSLNRSGPSFRASTLFSLSRLSSPFDASS